MFLDLVRARRWGMLLNVISFPVLLCVCPLYASCLWETGWSLHVFLLFVFNRSVRTAESSGEESSPLRHRGGWVSDDCFQWLPAGDEGCQAQRHEGGGSRCAKSKLFLQYTSDIVRATLRVTATHWNGLPKESWFVKRKSQVANKCCASSFCLHI